MPLVFESAEAKGKPDDNRRPTGYCPFCDVNSLTGILSQQADCIWLMNKYPTLRDTTQTVIIESSDHDGDFSAYPSSQARHIMRFSLDCWNQMESSGEFRSVLMYKNYGPLSGGSLHHPHLQIVGLKETDGYADIRPEHFAGIPVISHQGVAVNVSLEPVMGFFEANVIMQENYEPNTRNTFSDAVQSAIAYVLNEHHQGRCDSYNLFFYHMTGRIICKIVPRWITSPYFIGYRLAQINCPEGLREDARNLRERLQATL